MRRSTWPQPPHRGPLTPASSRRPSPCNAALELQAVLHQQPRAPYQVDHRPHLSFVSHGTLHRALQRRPRPRLNRASGAQLWLAASAQLLCQRRPRMIAPAVASCSAPARPAHRDVVKVPRPPSSSISPPRLMWVRLRIRPTTRLLLRSGFVGERVVFMGDDPAVAIPPQANCQPEPVAGVALQLLRRAAAQQSVRKGHVVPGGDVERDDLERCTLALPGEERWPGLAVSCDPTYAVFRRWHVKHDNVRAVIGENRI